MVSTSTVFFFFFFFMMFLVNYSCFASSTEARKLLRVQETLEKKMVPSEEEEKAAEYERLYLNALPKGKVPASTPSNKGHAQIIDEKLISRHLVAVDRILRSVPSPGVGH